MSERLGIYHDANNTDLMIRLGEPRDRDPAPRAPANRANPIGVHEPTMNDHGELFAEALMTGHLQGRGADPDREE